MPPRPGRKARETIRMRIPDCSPWGHADRARRWRDARKRQRAPLRLAEPAEGRGALRPGHDIEVLVRLALRHVDGVEAPAAIVDRQQEGLAEARLEQAVDRHVDAL